MLSIPVPFVVAFLLAMLAIANHARLRETPTGTLFGAVIWLYALSMVLIGFRWVFDQVIFFPIAAVLAVAGVVLLYLAFRSLGRTGPILWIARDWRHLIPVGCIFACVGLAPTMADLNGNQSYLCSIVNKAG